MLKINNYLLICISAVITGVTQHPLGLGFLSWISLIPLFQVLIQENRYKGILKYSLLWGIIYHLVVVYWLSSNIGTSPSIAFISMLAAVLTLSVNTVMICSIWFFVKDHFRYNLIVFAVIWVSIEYLRSFGLLGFPWISLANSQTDYLYLIQNSEFTGIYGVTFWILLTNIFIFHIKSYDYKSKTLYIGLFFLILPWITGYKLFQKYNHISSNKGLQTLLIQPNINLYDKRDFQSKKQTLDQIIQSSQNDLFDDTKLIIWPESAMPFHRMQNIEDRNYLINNLFKNKEKYLLSGNIFYENNDIYNSSVLVDSKGIKSVYHKRQLVPIAEYVPFSENFEFLRNINIGQTNFSKGKKDHIFDVEGYRLASLICFESTFPEINRRHANQNIDALIYLVNDGWYTTAPEPQQHAKQAVFRAIENRLPIIRCANTGISMIIDPSGKVINDIGLNKFGTINFKIDKNKYSKTFYTRFGNVFALILLVMTILFLIKSIIKNEKK